MLFAVEWTPEGWAIILTAVITATFVGLPKTLEVILKYRQARLDAADRIVNAQRDAAKAVKDDESQVLLTQMHDKIMDSGK